MFALSAPGSILVLSENGAKAMSSKRIMPMVFANSLPTQNYFLISSNFPVRNNHKQYAVLDCAKNALGELGHYKAEKI